ASILSQLVSFVYCYFCIRKIEYVNVRREMWKPDWHMIRSLTMFAIPISIETIVISLGGIILQATINAQGSIFIAGYTAVNKLYGLLECTAISLGVAFLTFFAQNYGAKRYDRVRGGVKSAILLCVVAASLVGAVIFIFGRQLAGIFLDGSMDGARDAIEIAWSYLRIMAICMNILYLIYVYRKVLQGMGNAFWSMLSGMFECVIRVGMGWLVAGGFDSRILFYIEPSAWLGALLFVAIPYYIIKEQYLGQ
ncbi:MAG: MATE family efflux transporter, partial [Oscillospiraceae bacterium]|nr:MATE family efflux transporter [Oscillospiraceae bacterium]